MGVYWGLQRDGHYGKLANRREESIVSASWLRHTVKASEARASGVECYSTSATVRETKINRNEAVLSPYYYRLRMKSVSHKNLSLTAHRIARSALFEGR